MTGLVVTAVVLVGGAEVGGVVGRGAEVVVGGAGVSVEEDGGDVTGGRVVGGGTGGRVDVLGGTGCGGSECGGAGRGGP
ncbi:MAG TPA: hypothetical protein VGN22_04765 [Pseudonocardia sp.]